MRVDREQITIPPDKRPDTEQPAWRRDFPIDWPQDHYVGRREFTKFMVLISLAFAVGQWCIALRSGWSRIIGRPRSRRLARLDEIPVGGAITFNFPGENDNCILVRPASGDLLAYSQKCTHLSCAVVPDVEKGCLNCPCHEGVFDLKTGRPIAGPPRRPLPRITLNVRGGEVFATGVEGGEA